MRMAIIKKSGGGGGGAVGTAKPPDVLAGKTFSSNEGTGLVGTMPNQGKKDFTPGKTPQTIPAGYHNGQGVVDSLGGDAEAGHVLEGKTFSSDIEGRAVNGTMPNRGAMIITPTRTGVIIPAGYHNGQGEVVGDPNFEAGNIKEGVEIWGVVGTLTPDSPPVGDALPEHVLAGKTFESAAAGTGAIGTMVDRGAVIITPGTNDISIPAGYHNGLGKVKAARLAISTKQAILVGSSFIVPMEQGYTFVEYPEVGNVEIKTDNDGYIFLSASNGSAGTGSAAEVSIVTTSPIDLSMFSSVNIIWNTYSGTTGGTRYVGLAVSPTKIAPYSDRTAGVSRSYSALPNDYVKSTLGISGLTGEYYIRVHAYVQHTVGRVSRGYIAGIYLE